MGVARFEKRVFSYLIDNVLPILFSVLGSILLLNNTTIPWYFILIIAILTAYFLFQLINVNVMAATGGYTIGSAIFQIKTVTINGNKISYRNALIKNLYHGIVPLVFANAIYMLVVHTEHTIFDKITDTIVVDQKNQ